MAVRAKLDELKRSFTPIFYIAAVVAVCVAVGWFLPAHTAALVLGALAAVLLHHFVVVDWQPATRVALLWAGLAVTADAAYAKLNDQAPVTVVGALAKMVEGAVKLADGLIRAVNLPVLDVRNKITAFTPDFLWALILALLVLMLANSVAKR